MLAAFLLLAVGLGPAAAADRELADQVRKAEVGFVFDKGCPPCDCGAAKP